MFICSLINGARWASGERRLEEGDTTALDQLAAAIGENPYQATIAAELKRHAGQYVSLSNSDRVQEFARVLRRIDPSIGQVRDPLWLPEYLLRLASSPDKALAWAGEPARAWVHTAMLKPIMLRAARYLVLAVHQLSNDIETGAAYNGWAWQ
jgi:hypothetical protein